ncbi:fibrillarin-like rRNA/tRNA 2'-O-methyltransferase [Candidatus Woesearchaeota archaeon]|nr:fibrillarin-like rRNA/tRNA 2'-O-methyltransferase [Candidatus Woesearchaeota archaeon]
MSLPNTKIDRRSILTKGLTKTQHFDRERRVGDWRILDPKHSKLGAALMKGCQQFGITEGCSVLYLGASHGYTPSYVSDMVGAKGTVYCVEFAPQVARDLVFLCEDRENMIPVVADANQPDTYSDLITGVDVLFQDVSQRNQVEIFLKNLTLYVKPRGFGMLAVKARSIDVLKKPQDIFKEIRKEFESSDDFVIVDYRELQPFEKDHAFFVVKKK